MLVESEYWDVGEAVVRTRELMADPTVPAIFEAAFVTDGIVIRADILQRAQGNRWRLNEVAKVPQDRLSREFPRQSPIMK